MQALCVTTITHSIYSSFIRAYFCPRSCHTTPLIYPPPPKEKTCFISCLLVCLSVCRSVRPSDYLKSNKRICRCLGPRNNRLHFGDDPHYDAHQGSGLPEVYLSPRNNPLKFGLDYDPDPGAYISKNPNFDPI